MIEYDVSYTIFGGDGRIKFFGEEWVFGVCSDEKRVEMTDWLMGEGWVIGVSEVEAD